MNKFLTIAIVFLFGFSSQRILAQDSLKLLEFNDEYTNAENDTVRLEILLTLISTNSLDDVDTVLNMSKTALMLAQELKDTTAMAVSNQRIASYYSVQSNYNEALRYDLEALELFEILNDSTALATSYNAFGEDYMNLDLYNEAFKYYKESLNIALQNKLGLHEAIARYNMGRVLIEMGQLDQAKKYIRQSMKKSVEVGDTIGLAYAHRELARIDIEQGDYVSAIELLDAAYAISVDLREDVLTPDILLTRALAFQESKNYQNAVENYDEALKLEEKLNNGSGIAEALYGKGTLSMKMGRYSEALSYFDKGLNISQEVGNNGLILKFYHALSGLYERNSNFQYALSFFKKYKDLEDSVFSEKKKEQFAQIQIQYETAQKDIEIQLLNEQEQQRKNELQNEEFIRNILVVILAFTAVLLFSLYKNNVKRKRDHDQLLEQQKVIESKSKELEGLLEMKDKFFSIISHDLRSPINALVGILDLLDDGHMTQKELQDVSNSLKRRLTNTKKLLDTLLDWAMLQMEAINVHEEEVEIRPLVDTNLEFFRELEDKSINYVNDIDKNTLVRGDRNMIDLIIRNLISNAIKFTEENGEVNISAEDGPKNMLIVTIQDNGIGMNSEQMGRLFDTHEIYTTRGTANEKGTGLGLRLCKEFVEKMGGNIWVESVEGKGSIFKFTIKRA